MFIASCPINQLSSGGAACLSDPDSFYRPESVTLIVRNTVALQKFEVFFLKRLSSMMRLLVANVVRDASQM
jgi:hypothetical protein